MQLWHAVSLVIRSVIVANCLVQYRITRATDVLGAYNVELDSYLEAEVRVPLLDLHAVIFGKGK